MARKKYVPTVVETSKIEKAFLSGKTTQEVKDDLGLEIPARCYTEVRKGPFTRLRDNPEELYRLANGPVLNACEVIRYSARRAKSPLQEKQSSILDICDGSMNAANQ